MFTPTNLFQPLTTSWFALVCGLWLTLATAQAQSTCAPDASGDFKPTADISCLVPDNGEFSYRDVVIARNVSVTYVRNLASKVNAPVVLKVSGNFTLNGAIILTGGAGSGRLGGRGGPGGYDGGRGGSSVDNRVGGAGDGPGGGAGGPAGVFYGGGGSYALAGNAGSSPNGAAGVVYGTNSLLPLVGGSGGGGGGADTGGVAGGGGGGGGALLIYCSGVAPQGIAKFENLSSASNPYGIKADGGAGSCGTTGTSRSGSGGSGGAIRLVADTVIGDPGFDVTGGSACATTGGQLGGAGYVRVEARDQSQFKSPAATLVTSFTKGPVTLTNNPMLKIKSVGGQTVPTTPVGSFYQPPDLTVPANVTNPVTVIVEGTNLPANTPVTVTLTQITNAKESKNCSLLGTPVTCSVSVTLPNSGTSVITASATLDVLLAFQQPIYRGGERVLKMEIATALGGASTVTYITESGRRIQVTE